MRRVEIDLGLRMEMRHYPEVIARDIATIRSALRSNTGAQPASEERERALDALEDRIRDEERRAVRRPAEFVTLTMAEAKALRALRSSPPVAPEGARDWRPIETAPKDGTVVVGWFVSTRPNWSVLPPSADVMYWTDHNGGGWVRHAHGEPMYWHPLPPTPPGAARPHAGDER